MSFYRPQTDCGGSISRKWVASFVCAFGSALLLFSSHVLGKQDSLLLNLNVDNAVATAGYYRLDWQWLSQAPADDIDFELQESPHQDFSTVTTRYQGPDLATVISGQSDGMRYYRIRPVGAGAAWSNVVQVETQHHPLSRAIRFFAVGAVVFVLTLIVILRGKPPEHQA